ncbi:hypothetical protein A616_28750 [Brevibacillus brevis X23]|nr:hypothetical protein A616_28750 [Brevibacillus brevis X23]
MPVVKQVVTCEVCETKTLVKFQVGNLQQYPVHYSCPICLTHIYGDILNYHDERRVEYHLHNATHENGEIAQYILVVAGEFPSIKIVPYTEETYKAALFSPFIRYSPHNEEDVHMYDFLIGFLPELIKLDWKKVERIANLYFNNQDKYLEGEIDKLRTSPRFILSPYEKDSSVSKLVTTVFRKIGSKNPLTSVTIDDVIQRLETIPQTQQSSYMELLQYFSISDLVHVQKDLFNLFNTFIAHYRYLVPVIYLEALGRDLDSIKMYEGINTVSFERLDKLYQNTYETLLEHSTVAFMLDNLFVRGSIHSINSSITVGRHRVASLDDYQQLTKGQKLKYLADNSNLLSPVFGVALDHTLRNPIGHNDYTYDPNNQLIQFHSTNPNLQPKLMFLIEFADKCYQSMKINLLLWDITVLLKKLITEQQKL